MVIIHCIIIYIVFLVAEDVNIAICFNAFAIAALARNNAGTIKVTISKVFPIANNNEARNRLTIVT